MNFSIRIRNHILYDLKIVKTKYSLQIRKMPKRNIKSFKFVKSVLLMFCVVIVLTVGLVILRPQKSKESTPKSNESMPEEKGFESILSFITNIYFFLNILFLN
jgi:K+-transporting ATPase A subunit